VLDLALSRDFKSIVLDSTPLIDVRSPVEFNKGAFPHTVNLPLMSDEERHIVGICYKEKGEEEALALGYEMVKDSVKDSRVKDWIDFIKANPNAMLYCFRGGQRSQISQGWIGDADKDIVRLDGGYRAFRRYLIEYIDNSPKHFKPTVLGGRTGSGKTILLKKLQNFIDLEALANHRGSSFGRHINPQPSQINFENSLAYELIQKIENGYTHLVFEDEGRNVGRNHIPDELSSYLSTAPLVILETTMEQRVEVTFDEYVLSSQSKHKEMHTKDYIDRWQIDIKSSMARIKKRLGGLRYQKVSNIFQNALQAQLSNGSTKPHKEWIEYLLREYYDPSYDYQIQQSVGRVVFRGDAGEVLEYLSGTNIT